MPTRFARRLLYTLYVGVIGKNDIDTVKQVAETVFVDGETFE